MTLTRAAVVALAALLPPSAAALDPRKVITQYGHDVWHVEDGLPHSTVRVFEQTRDGYLWIGTEEGLARFDGVRFTVFDTRNTPEMRDAFITALHEDRAGNLWIGTNGAGPLKFRDGRFTSPSTPAGKDAKLHVAAIVEDGQGTVWVGTQQGGLFQIRDGALVLYSSADTLPIGLITALHVDPAGRLWIGSRSDGVVVLQDGQFRAYTAADGLSDNQIWCFADGADGSLWIGTQKGLGRLDKTGAFTTSVPGESIRAVLTDRDGNLWVATNEGGVRRVRGAQSLQFTKAHGLTSISVRAFFEDREGSLWVGTADGGLNRLRDGPFTTVSQREGLSDDRVTTVHEGGQGVWVGTNGGGLNLIRDGRISVFTTRDGLSKDSISSLGGDRTGALWAGTNGAGLNRFRDGRFTVYTTAQGLGNDSVFALLGGRDGGLWVGTRGGGLNHLDGERFVGYRRKEGLLNSFVWDLAEDRAGTLWIGGAGGVFTLAGGRMTQVIPDIPAHNIHIDAEGVVWVGTARRGLYRFKEGKAAAITSREGLLNDTISQILEDDHENLWLGSNKGISRVDKKQLDDVAEGRSRRITPVSYDTSDGMKSAECNYGRGCRTKDGRLWFPTIRGVVIVDPEKVKANPLVPPVVVERVLADGNEVAASGEGAAIVPPGEGRLEFQYTALSYLAPRKVRFAYRLEGFDQAWSEPGPRRDATYTNLRPGRYTFRVRASNNDGVWNEAGAAFPLYLQPHFYETWWFYALCAAALLGAVWRIHLFRMRRVLEMERVRTRIAADLHDDIGSGLSQIAILSEVARQQLPKDGDRAADSLGRIAGTAGELVDSMSDIVWAVNPRKDRMEDLVHRMRRFANDVLSGRGMDVVFRTSGVLGEQRLEPDFRRHVYLMFKESVNNAARHSGGRRVDIALEVRSGQLFLQVKDDGRGFDGSRRSDGHGLGTMALRAAELGGVAEISSRSGQGTVLTASVPLGRHRTHLNR